MTVSAQEVLGKLNAVTEAITGVDDAVAARVDSDAGMESLAIHAGGQISAGELATLVAEICEHQWMLVAGFGGISPEHLKGIVTQSVLAGIFIGTAP